MEIVIEDGIGGVSAFIRQPAVDIYEKGEKERRKECRVSDPR